MTSAMLKKLEKIVGKGQLSLTGWQLQNILFACQLVLHH